jgi:5-methylcytosine-specific restriction endonuclease McrA
LNGLRETMNKKNVNRVIRETYMTYRNRVVTDRRLAYRSYIQSEEWKQKRAEKLRANPSCEMCDGFKHRQVHHLTYERLGNELLDDLVTLCRRCHAIEHSDISDTRKAKIWRYIAARQKKSVRRRRRRRNLSPGFVSHARNCLHAVRNGNGREYHYKFLRRYHTDILRITNL